VISHVRADERPPAIVDDLISEAYRGIIDPHIRTRQTA
jgi:hypothetical protein